MKSVWKRFLFSGCLIKVTTFWLRKLIARRLVLKYYLTFDGQLTSMNPQWNTSAEPFQNTCTLKQEELTQAKQFIK